MKKQGIYYLVDKNDDVVYIGQSVDIYTRINNHRNVKDFNSFRYIEVEDREQLNCVELEEIIKHMPKLNKKLPPNNEYRELGTLKKEFGSVIFPIVSLICNTIKVGDTEYISESERKKIKKNVGAKVYELLIE